jgi:replication factor C subunit 2/4
MKERLLYICQQEECSPEEVDLVDDILDLAEGDMRRAVTTLQSVHALARGGSKVDTTTLAEIVGVPPSAVVEELYAALAAPTFDSLQRAVESVCASGYSAQLLLSALLPKISQSSSLHELAKAEIAIRMAESEKNMIEGADEYLQLLCVCSVAQKHFQMSQ